MVMMPLKGQSREIVNLCFQSYQIVSLCFQSHQIASLCFQSHEIANLCFQSREIANLCFQTVSLHVHWNMLLNLNYFPKSRRRKINFQIGISGISNNFKCSK